MSTKAGQDPAGFASLAVRRLSDQPVKQTVGRILSAMEIRDVVHVNPQILGGTPVFVGTRVPFRALIDYLEGGHDLDDFLEDFPSVSRDLAIAALEAAHEVIAARARSA